MENILSNRYFQFIWMAILGFVCTYYWMQANPPVQTKVEAQEAIKRPSPVEYHIPPTHARARITLTEQELREINTAYSSSEERLLARLERQYGSEIRYWAAAYPGCPWILPLSLLRNESSGNPYAISRARAMGLMQLIPSTATHVGVDDPWDPSQNIYGGVKYACRDVVRAGARSVEEVAIGYNWGPHRLPRYWQNGWLPYETRVYQQRVASTFRLARQMFDS